MKIPINNFVNLVMNCLRISKNNLYSNHSRRNYKTPWKHANSAKIFDDLLSLSLGSPTRRSARRSPGTDFFRALNSQAWSSPAPPCSPFSSPARWSAAFTAPPSRLTARFWSSGCGTRAPANQAHTLSALAPRCYRSPAACVCSRFRRWTCAADSAP